MSPYPAAPARVRRFGPPALLAGLCLAVMAAAADGGAAEMAKQSLASAPLAERSRPAGRTLFSALPPERTGIVTLNEYADPKMWTERYLEFTTGSIGTGIAIADYDNDGRPDLFVVSKTGSNRLFRNLGGWKFEDVTVAAGIAPATSAIDQGLAWLKGRVGSGDAEAELGRWKQGAAFADVNNDGWLDLYVCRFNAPNLLYVSQRDGTFKEEAAARGLALTDASGMGAFCDYDRDGWLDVFVQTNLLDATRQPGGRPDRLLRNRGDGTFVDVSEKAGIVGETLAHSATWWDYDEDGWPDLYVANDFAGTDRLYRNQRDGTFKEVIHQVVPSMPYSAMGADLGDVNNDGLVDLLVADMAATTHEKDQRGMAVSREMTRDDIDDPARAPQVVYNTLYLNTGTGRMLQAARLAGIAATDWTWSVRFEDLDEDGRLDLHVTNGMNREYQNSDLRDRVMITESAAERVRLMKDGPPLLERNLVYRNAGDLRFEEAGKAWGLDQEGVSYGAAFGDLDGDGDLDLVVANHEAGVTVLRNDNVSGHHVIFALRGSTSNRFGVGATVRIETATGVQVRQLVLARGYLSSSEPVLHFGLGESDRMERVTVEWPSGHRQVFTGIAADRRYTITEPPGPAPQQVSPSIAAAQFAEVGPMRGLAMRVEESFDPETQPLLPVRFDRRGPALAVGDLDGDGRDDVVLGGTGKQAAQVLQGGPVFSRLAGLMPSPVDDGPLLLFEANGDGRPDLLQTRSGTNRPAGSTAYQPVLHLNSGGGINPAPEGALPALPISVGAAVAADFDHDGRLDVFLGGRVLPGKYPLSPRSALLANRGGRFEDVTDTVAPALREVGMVSSALWSDVNGDGWPDLLVALEWGGVKYFRNEAGRGFVDASVRAGFSAAGTGWWTALCSADFNGDGRPDYVAGNVGLNTSYHAPALLFTGRFASGTATQLVEAEQEGDRLYPRRTLKALGAAIPDIRRRFPKNDDYAKATLGRILGEERLAAATRYEATELQSGVFLSQPDGTHRFTALPHIAQIAPLQGVVAGDFDGDGYADIYAVQNSYAPIGAIGRFDGGLSQLLRGDGRGGFTPVAPLASGLVVPGDAKALVTLDLDDDGWPDFLVSRNNAATLAWHNGGVAGRHAFEVVLRGPNGNPTAVGASVTVELADGRMQAMEVQAGGGYYSQSTPGLFFGYPDENPPRRCRVRWPDGRTSEQEFVTPPTGKTVLTVP